MEKALVVQKDEEIQVALLETNEEKAMVIKKFKGSEEFSDLQFIQYFKGFELLRKWMTKHHSAVVDFSNLDFEKINAKILKDESNEPERDKSGVPEKDKATDGKNMDESSAPP